MSEGRENLERLVDGLARGQPLRRAPASLQARVLAELATRQTPTPWWRKGFTHWPVAARGAFLIASYAFIRFALAGVMLITAFVRSDAIAVEAPSWARLGAEAASATASMAAFIVHTIPPMWLYAAAAFASVLYALLFALGTVAYRTLYVER